MPFIRYSSVVAVNSHAYGTDGEYAFRIRCRQTLFIEARAGSVFVTTLNHFFCK